MFQVITTRYASLYDEATQTLVFSDGNRYNREDLTSAGKKSHFWADFFAIMKILSDPKWMIGDPNDDKNRSWKAFKHTRPDNCPLKNDYGALFQEYGLSHKIL